MANVKQSSIATAAGLALGLCAPAQAAPLTFSSIYSFPANSYYPGQAIDIGGQVYGVTFGGGTIGGPAGDLGVIFQFDPATGAESALTSFQDNFQGYNPNGLISSGKRLLVYMSGGGELEGGFPGGSGTIISYNRTTGKSAKLFDFIQIDFGCSANDLLQLNGQLYGTCNNGLGPSGNGDNGILFQIDAKTGAGKILYAFQAGADGGFPSGAVVYANGALYGAVTEVSGNYNVGGVFSYNLTTGAETLIHQFAANKEGSYPSGVVLCDGMVAGLNQSGGANGEGAAFSVDPSTGANTTLYTFQDNGIDGTFPFTWAPACLNKSLYGTAARGGSAGMGTVFEIRMKNGGETILHSFTGPDGENPYTALTSTAGTLYGTTTLGGTNNGGTIFKLAP